MTTDVVQLSIENQIATVTLNRPEKHNAINMDMFKTLAKIIKQLKKDKSLRAVILSGNGPDFCSGLDVKSVLADKKAAIKLLWKWYPGQPNLAQIVSVGWRHLNVPVISAIHGRCWGGGTQIVMGTDYRIAAPDACFSIMEGKWGLIPDMGGSLGLRENVSVDMAMRWAMTAEEISSQQAYEHKLISQIDDNPYAKAMQLARQLSERNPDAIAAVKKIYHKAWHKNDGAILNKESWFQWRNLLGKNQKIAVKRQMTATPIEYKPRQNW